MSTIARRRSCLSFVISRNKNPKSSFRGANWCRSAAVFVLARLSKRRAPPCAKSGRRIKRLRRIIIAHSDRRRGLILKVHRSNFFMSGFVDSPSTAELAALARKKRIPFLEDLGSGAIAATEKFAELEHEPMAPETLRAGADLICFSGDKLFGGPQAGIIAGRERFVSALKRDPLFRALRCDKLVLSALQATADLHLAKNYAAIPALAFLQIPVSELQERAEKILAQLQDFPLEVRIEQTDSRIGGGALPRSKIKSVSLSIRSRKISRRTNCRAPAPG